MWSIEKLESIRDNCMEDMLEMYPELSEQLIKPRIEICHKTSTTMARYARSYIEVSAYLLAGSTREIFFQTLIMMGLIRGQICKLIPDLYEEEIVWVLNDRFPGKFDFKEYKNLQKQNIELPKKQEQIYKYAVCCPNCGEMFRFKRICKTVLNPKDYVCTKCNVPLERMKYLQTNSSM